MNVDKSVSRDLERHYLFAALSDRQARALLAHTHRRRLEPGQLLFGQNDPARAFFLLCRGEIKLYRVSAEGQEKVMRLIRPHMSFAESVMFMDAPRYPVHAEALQASDVLAIEARAYLRILRESFETCQALMAQMTRRIQAHWDEIEALTLQNGRYRIVHYLLGLIPAGARCEARVTLPSRKSLIATQLAVTPETLSRLLHALGEEGLIDVDEYTVRIPDIERLRLSLSQ